MRIALLTRHFSRTAGGAESYAIAVAQELCARHEVHVFCQETDRPVSAAVYHQVWRPFRRPRWLNQIYYALATWWLTRRGYDVVHSHEHVFHGDVQTLHVQPVSQGIWGKRQGWRRAWRTCAVLTSPRRMTYLWLEWARMRPLPGRTLVFASAPLLNQFETYYPHIRRIAQVIPPGVHIPVSVPDRQASRRSVGWSLDSPWLLFVANDYQRKGLMTLLQALQNLPNEVQLAVVGQNRQQARFEALAINLGVASRVHFLGPRQDVEVLMSAADVLVHPTTEDSFGMVVLEAMAQGLPVVVSAAPHCGLSAELTHLQDAWLLSDPKDNEGLAQAMQAILTQTELRSHLTQGGRAQALGRTWAQAALKYETIMTS
jgi:UDP-glucose:(heptosyl)LPS alpha-1,3-glucosyltransferase